jgi:hypothetical protein
MPPCVQRYPPHGPEPNRGRAGRLLIAKAHSEDLPSNSDNKVPDLAVIEDVPHRGLHAHRVDQTEDLRGSGLRFHRAHLTAIDPELDDARELGYVLAHPDGDFLAQRWPVPARLPGVEPKQADLVALRSYPFGNEQLELYHRIRGCLCLVKELV